MPMLARLRGVAGRVRVLGKAKSSAHREVVKASRR
jgi:hypothetical protein